MWKKKLYVVGYDEDHSCIYGKDENGKAMYCQPMSAYDANRKLKEMPIEGAVIYKLVKVKEAL